MLHLCLSIAYEEQFIFNLKKYIILCLSVEKYIRHTNNHKLNCNHNIEKNVFAIFHNH